MKPYTVFIKESAQDGIIQRFNVYKTYGDKYLTGRRAESFKAAIDVFTKAVQDGQIYNPVFKDNYSYGLSRGMEDIYKAIENLYQHLPTGERPYYVFNNAFSGPQSVGSYLKAIKGHEQTFPLINQFLNDFKMIKDDVNHIKTLIVAGRAPKPVDPNKFVKPVSSYDAKKKVVAFLDEAVKSFKEQYEASVRADYTHAFAAVSGMKDAKEISKLTGDQGAVASQIFIIRQRYLKEDEVELKQNPLQIVERMIRDAVDGVIGEFIAKNTSKLSILFDKKQEVKDHKILSTKIRNSSLENDMYFEFTDSSNFIITSDIVYSYSKYGRPFLKLVTRFRNVRLADGSQMSGPSEEKMIKEF